MEKIKINPYKINNLYYALMNGITNPKEADAVIRKAKRDGNDFIFETEFKVNGYECSFEKVVEKMCSSLNEKIEKRAREIVQEKFSGILDKVAEIQECLEDIDIEVKEENPID